MMITQMRVELCESEHVWLIAEMPTGVTYTAQCAGMACNHRDIIGAVAATAPDTIGDAMCDLSCYWHHGKWTPEEIAKANEALASLCWSTFTSIVDLRMDEARLGESEEGWWRVTFGVQRFDDPAPVMCSGVVCGPNCD